MQEKVSDYLTDTTLELASHLADPEAGVLNGAGNRLVRAELLRQEAGLPCKHTHRCVQTPAAQRPQYPTIGLFFMAEAADKA